MAKAKPCRQDSQVNSGGKVEENANTSDAHVRVRTASDRAGREPLQRGFVPFCRSLNGHPAMADPLAWWVYTTLAYRARFHNGGVERVPGTAAYIWCEIGQCVCGRQELAVKAGVGERAIRTRLRRLVTWGLISRKATKRGSLITMLGYGAFWLGQSRGRPSAGPSSDQPSASRRPLTDTEDTGDRDTQHGDLDKARDPGESRRPSVSEERRVWERHHDQRLATLARTVEKLWSSTGGRKAASDYVLRGLLQADDQHGVAEDVCDQLETSNGHELPRSGESLWGWYQRVTGAWYGAEGDVRFSAEYREEHGL